MPNKNYYYLTHGFGYTKLRNSNDNFIQEFQVFVPNEDSLKIMKFKIKNIINEERRIKFLVYIKPVLGEDEYLTNGNICIEKENNILKIINVFEEESFKNKILYVTSNLEINSFTGEKDNFFGEGSISDPDALYRNLNNESGLGKNSCIGIEFNLKFDKSFSKILLLVLNSLTFTEASSLFLFKDSVNTSFSLVNLSLISVN